MAPFQDILHYVTSNYPEDQFQFNSFFKGFFTSSINKNFYGAYS